MEQLLEALKPSLLEMATVIATFLMGYLGMKVKLWLDTQQKQAVAESAVKFVEQVALSLGSAEKLKLAKEKALELLAGMHIKVSEAELDILIEAAVNEFFGKYKTIEFTVEDSDRHEVTN